MKNIIIPACIMLTVFVLFAFSIVFSKEIPEKDEGQKEIHEVEAISEEDRGIIEHFEILENLDLFMQEDLELFDNLELFLADS